MTLNMKARYILFAVAALAISACAKSNNEIPEQDGVQMTITAYQEGAEMTRTTVQEGGTQVYWEPSDEVKVFFKGSSGRFISQNTENAAVTDFSGTINIFAGANEGANSSNLIWGLYPYRADATFDGSSVTTTLPASQTGRAGSFAKNTHITLAQSGGLDLAFYNVCGGLRFSLTQEGIKRVTFEGNNGEAIAGKIKVTFADGIPVVQEVSEAQTMITLTAPNGGTFQTGQWYYLEAIPGTLSGGYKMMFYKESESAKLTSLSTVKIKRGIFGSLSDADEDLIFKETGGGENPNFIVFADNTVKTACVNRFDTDGDGELSYEEAANVKSITGLFDNYRFIESFDEFRYFTSVIAIPDRCFARMTILSSITLPESIKTIGNYAFYECTKLKAFYLPKSVYSIGMRAFVKCYSLESFVFDPESKLSILDGFAFEDIDGNTKDYSGIFGHCTSLLSITIPASVSRLGYRTFYDCTSLKSVFFEDGSSLSSIPGYDWNGVGGPFSGCTALETIVLPETVTSLGYGAFSGCSSLKNINLSPTLQSIGGSAFIGCKSLSGELNLPSVQSIGAYAFYNCEKIVSIRLSDNCTTIGAEAFSECRSLTSITLSKALTSIENFLFYNCSSLANITLPKYLSRIGRSAFVNCTSLKTITIPSDVIFIDDYAFSGCSGLSLLIVEPTTPPAGGIGMLDDTNDAPISVPSSSVEAYKTAQHWSSYANRIQAISGDTPSSGESSSSLMGLWATVQSTWDKETWLFSKERVSRVLTSGSNSISDLYSYAESNNQLHLISLEYSTELSFQIKSRDATNLVLLDSGNSTIPLIRIGGEIDQSLIGTWETTSIEVFDESTGSIIRRIYPDSFIEGYATTWIFDGDGGSRVVYGLNENDFEDGVYTIINGRIYFTYFSIDYSISNSSDLILTFSSPSLDYENYGERLYLRKTGVD